MGDIRQCLNITIIDDKIEEGNIGETFFVQLVPASGSSDHILFDVTQLYGIVIEDSDGKLGVPGRVEFSNVTNFRTHAEILGLSNGVKSARGNMQSESVKCPSSQLEVLLYKHAL